MSQALGFYGKLPHLGDFIRWREESPVHAGFRSWLEASWDNVIPLIPDQDAHTKLPWISGIVLFDDPSSSLLMLCKSSNDKAGRKFPFAVYSEIPDEAVSEHLMLVPCANGLFLQIGRRHFSRTEQSFADDNQARENTIWSLREGAKSDMTESRLKYTRYVNTTTLKSHLKALGIDLENLRQILWGLTAARGSYSDQFRAILRFPISDDFQVQSMQITMWMDLVQKMLGISSLRVCLFWTERYLDIAFGLPGPRALLTSWLPHSWLPDHDADFIWDFRAMKLESPQLNDDFGARLEEALGSEETTLSAILVYADKISKMLKVSHA
jgi:type VI secretion system ImpM family protein